MYAMTAFERTRRLLVAIAVAMQTLHAAATHDVSIVLHPQGVLEVPRNATAAVVCKVQRLDNSQNFVTFFTWNGVSLPVGDPYFNNGLLKVVYTECVTDPGHVCEKFELTVKGASAANGSIVGCFSSLSRNSSTQVLADGHVQIMVTDSESGTSVVPSPTPTITIVTSPSLGSTSSGTGTNMTIDMTPSPTGVSRGSETEGVFSTVLMTALLVVIVDHLL